MAPNAEPEKDFPWWLVILVITGLWLFYEMLSDDVYKSALTVLSKGLVVTLAVAVVAYVGACCRAGAGRWDRWPGRVAPARRSPWVRMNW